MVLSFAGICRALQAFWVALLLPILAAGMLYAEELMDPKALDLFKQMSATVGQAETVQFKAYALFDDFETSGVKYKRGLVQEVTIHRPNKLHYRTIEDNGTIREGWYDGQTFTVAQPQKRLYAQIKAPATLDELLDVIQDKSKIYLPTVDILYSDLYGQLKDHLLSGVYIGENIVDDNRLDHISFETTPADVQFWIEKGGIRVPRRIVLTFTAVKGEPEYLVIFRNWILNAFVNDGEFRFVPPKDWKQVELP